MCILARRMKTLEAFLSLPPAPAGVDQSACYQPIRVLVILFVFVPP